jgi:two-component system sensor kinase FixL
MDISETLLRLESLQQELMHVGRLNDLSQMGSTIAHELNQPLTAITNYLHATRRMVEASGSTDTDRLAAALDKAAAQALRVGAIIERLRRFVEKREAPYAYRNVNDVVAEASQLALVGASRSGVTLRAEFIPETVTAFIDKIQIQQVVVNLMRNAVDAMAQSHEKILSIATRRDGAFVTVTVTDTGPGLSHDIVDQLFKPFVTTKDQGMGLGLSICRQIIEAHAGQIGIEKSDAGGARFFFTLPLAASPRDRTGDVPLQ